MLYTETQQIGVIALLTPLHRLAHLCITEAMRTTTTSVMEVLQNLTGLHLHVQRETSSVTNTWKNTPAGALFHGRVTCLATDNMVPTHNSFCTPCPRNAKARNSA